MRIHFIFLCLAVLSASPLLSQDDSIRRLSAEPDYVPVFSSPKHINIHTPELLSKGILEFRVTHNFGDVAGDNGGIKNFFGLDMASDVRIGFQYGLSKRMNLIAARTKGAGMVQQLYETGIKYSILRQANDRRHPFALTFFGNMVASAMKANPVPEQENSFDGFSDRISMTGQLIMARRFGKVSLQVNPTVVHRNYVGIGDDNTLFALGGAIRVPVRGKFSLLVDYSHTFRSSASTKYFKTQDIRFYDALGVGIEMLTAGHVFHLNFTNATEILENRYVPRTITSWTKGQYRWGFTISRDFDLLWKKSRR